MKKRAGTLLWSIILIFGVTQTAEAQLNITLPDTSFEASQSEFQIPIYVENLAPDSILGFSFTIVFNPSVITMDTTQNGSLNGFTKAGTLSSGFSIVQNMLSDNEYRVSGAGTTPIEMDGVMMYLNMIVAGEGISEVQITDIEINEGEPAFTYSNGLVTIGNPSLVEVISPLGTVELEENFGHARVADLDTVFTSYAGETLSYQITYTDSSDIFDTGIVEESILALSSYSSAFGEGEVIVRAFSGNQEAFDTLKVIVHPVNDAPYFYDLPDTLRIQSGTTFSFNYASYVDDVEDTFDDLSFEFKMDPDTVDFQLEVKGDTLLIGIPDYTGFVTLSLRVTDTGGKTTEASIVLELMGTTSAEQKAEVPEAFKLHQNYPNPFNPATVIWYQLPVSSQVSLKLYDLMGREVATLVTGQMAAGEHKVHVDASKLSSGVYIYRLTSGDFVETKKMILIK
ncbi:MAG: T9SS type A sorting domain-containing protein [Gracilimonas sp.]